VYAAASSPLVTIQPTATLRSAAAKMTEERIKRLPVSEGIDLVGIVTATDLLAAQADLDAETRRYLREREGGRSTNPFDSGGLIHAGVGGSPWTETTQ